VDVRTRKRLISAALRARRNAYSRYSGFSVGAAVLSSRGKIYAGANVENASYGATICAERSAVCAAVTAGETDIVALAVTTGTDPAYPSCGICRQVLFEFGPDMEILLVSEGRKPERLRLSDLLPRAFGPSFLDS
jgi:cytidine deaminase